MSNIRRIDLWVGRSAAVAGLAVVVLARVRPAHAAPDAHRAKRTVTATVVRCPERRRLRGAALVVATCAVAVVAGLVVTIQAAAPGSNAWTMPLVGPSSDK